MIRVRVKQQFLAKVENAPYGTVNVAPGDYELVAMVNFPTGPEAVRFLVEGVKMYSHWDSDSENPYWEVVDGDD